ncbi:MAG: hypothetical protein ACREIP_14090 [Alphaproteobacteria bacterium]
MRAGKILALILSVAPMAACDAVAQGSRSVTFDFQKPGAAPAAFACEVTGPGGPGRWVVTQALAEGGIRRVLAQTSQIAAPDRLPHCVLKNYRGADVDAVVLIRPVSGTRAQAGGIIWRVLDRQNYYALLIDAKSGEMSILRMERGRAAPLPIAGEDRKFAHRVRLERDRWYQLRVRAMNARFEVFLDDAKRFEVEDGALRGAGAVGLVTLGDSVIQFDAFNVAPAR